MKFQVGQKVKVISDGILPGNDIAPKLTLEKEYEILSIEEDSKGNQHINVGIESTVNFVTSYETKEHLPHGDKIHWCHPSRFELVK